MIDDNLHPYWPNNYDKWPAGGHSFLVPRTQKYVFKAQWMIFAVPGSAVSFGLYAVLILCEDVMQGWYDGHSRYDVHYYTKKVEILLSYEKIVH